MAVFGSSTEKPTVLKAGRAILTVGSETMIALNVTVQYQRQVDVVPVLGTKRVISIGEAQGTVSIESLVSKNSINSAFHLDDDGCSPFDITLKISDGGCDEANKSITCKNCVASALTITAQGGRGYIAEGVQVTFTALTA